MITLNMSKVEATVKMTLGMINQKWYRSLQNVDGLNLCRYRGDNNAKCAVGHLIPDADYNRDMEGLAAHKIVECDFEDFLSEIQTCHDYSRNRRDLRDRWKDVLRAEGIFSEVCKILLDTRPTRR